MNRHAPMLVKNATKVAVCCPLAAGVVLLLLIAFPGYSFARHGLALVYLVFYGSLSALYFRLFRPMVDPVEISAKAGACATFWAGYVAIYVAAFVWLVTEESPDQAMVALMIAALIAFVPVLATLVQALVPEAFWPISPKWQARMLTHAAFTLSMHLFLSLVVLAIAAILML